MTDELKTPWRQRAREHLEAEKRRLVGEDGEGGVRASISQQMVEESQANMRAYAPNPDLHKKVLVWYVAGQTILAIISTSLMYFIGSTGYINSGLLLLLLQITHIALSLRSVQVEDLAGTTFFGRPTSAPEPGWVFVPWLLMRLHTVSRNYKDYRFPGPANKILRISTEAQKDREFGDTPSPEQIKEGFVRPIIVTSGEPKLTAGEKSSRSRGLNVDPFDERNSFEIAYVIRFRPNQEAGGIFRLIRNIGIPTMGTTMEQMMVDHLRENSERDIKAIIANQTLATVIENQSLVNEVFAHRVEVSVMRLGFDIDENGTGLDDTNPSHQTNEALANARRARFARQQTIIAADAEREKRVREGQGIAEAERLLLEARAAGFKKIKEDTGVDGDVVIASETARNFKDANTIFGAQGIKEILAMPGLLNSKEDKKEE